MKKAMNVLFSLVILCGVGLLAYGGYLYVDGKAQEKKAYAEANQVLENRAIGDSESSGPSLIDMWNEKQTFEQNLKQGDTIGKLLIPRLDEELPIVEGADPDSLLKGVGHMSTTSLPLDNNQTVLSGHRDTVFLGIASELEVGDIFVVQLPYGDFEYKITDMYIVDADDRTVIVPHDSETLTVTTCYPFDFIGYAPQRYIMNAEPTFDMAELDGIR